MKKGLIFIAILVVIFTGLYFFKDQIFKIEKEPTGVVIENGQIEQWNKESKEINGKAKNNEFLFKVAQAATTGPRFLSGKLEPQDVLPGQTQKMEIKMTDPVGIQSVIAKIEHDQGFDEVKLKLTEGTEFEGTWKGDWLVHSTHDKFYKTIFTATNKEDQQDILTLAWKDQCPLKKGNWTINNNCTVTAGAVGTMDGDIVIGATVTLSQGSGTNGYLVFGAGLSPRNKVTFTSGGKITMAGGVLIKAGNVSRTPGQFRDRIAAICLPDSDNDNYWPATVLAGEFYIDDVQTVCPFVLGSTTIRQKKITVLTNRGDCDDTRPLIIPSACHWDLTNFPRQKCASNFSGSYVSSCGDGVVDIACGETCEVGQTSAGPCQMSGNRYCGGGTVCAATGSCTIDPPSCIWCNGGCCPASYPYCFGTKCCMDYQPPGDRYCVNPSGSGSSSGCPLGTFCCGTQCCPNRTICGGSRCFTTIWSSCGPLSALYSPSFRIAVDVCSSNCTPGESGPCTYSTTGERECKTDCTAWGTNCVGGIQE